MQDALDITRKLSFGIDLFIPLCVTVVNSDLSIPYKNSKYVIIIKKLVGVAMKKIKSNFVFGALIQCFLSAGLFTVTLLMMINAC